MEESIPIVRTLLTELTKAKSFSEINTCLHLITHTSQKTACNPWNFNYADISGVVMSNKDDGIFLGLESQPRYPNIYADFAYEIREGKSLIHLQPVFLYKAKIMGHIFSNLEKIRSGIFNFNYLEDGEYLKGEAELVLEHAEQLSLEEEIPLLELFDQIAEKLAIINAERVVENRPVVEFAKQYGRGKRLIEGVPPGRRTPSLERRLNM